MHLLFKERERAEDPFLREFDVVGVQFNSEISPAVLCGYKPGRAGTAKRIEHGVALSGSGQDAGLDQVRGECREVRALEWLRAHNPDTSPVSHFNDRTKRQLTRKRLTLCAETSFRLARSDLLASSKLMRAGLSSVEL